MKNLCLALACIMLSASLSFAAEQPAQADIAKLEVKIEHIEERIRNLKHNIESLEAPKALRLSRKLFRQLRELLKRQRLAPYVRGEAAVR